ncbi:ABC-2 type transport system ATP-binding protein [Motilibacter rhizosphaerae]|uniref:ABC-2 type transport system ATP-binding protein n=1 Tax=Motilibacter rhizosphaerae TaxID=598652 RepID=A0A4Q7NW36_9ACTN|nr:ATP-binding cassette domain-containing protein [Motilibacter rhizosphaerae]RZS91481.1 ABC-2 type transport system ATP-binding protein [Motilibacter rhizosphaerae]
MLEIRSLRKAYGDTVALDDLSLTVRPGEVFGFVGQNGAGKTTTMRIVLGVLAADSGEVHWDGRPMDAAARLRTGYMPEERGLYPKMRVRDQLVYLARLHGSSAPDARRSTDELLAALGLEERADSRIEALSLGNQQRVQLAAALVHDPELLVLDEPFSGLDPVGVDALAATLRTRVDRGVPVLFSSHQLDLVERLCDSVGIVKAGRVVAEGSVGALRQQGRARRLRVRTPDAAWAQGLPGVLVLSRDGDAQLLELADDVDDQTVLDAARRSGPVHEFAPVLPSLTELFREVVAA